MVTLANPANQTKLKWNKESCSFWDMFCFSSSSSAVWTGDQFQWVKSSNLRATSWIYNLRDQKFWLNLPTKRTNPWIGFKAAMLPLGMTENVVSREKLCACCVPNIRKPTFQLQTSTFFSFLGEWTSTHSKKERKEIYSTILSSDFNFLLPATFHWNTLNVNSDILRYLFLLLCESSEKWRTRLPCRS